VSTVPRHPAGFLVHEHELTLAVAYRLKALLENDGASVCVTRRPTEAGGGLQIAPYDFTGDGRVRPIGIAVEDVPEVIQPRIDWANAFEAEVMLSVHFNGAEDRSARGTEVYYSDTGARQEEGRRLAASILEALLTSLEEAGHPSLDRGLSSDHYQRYTAEQMRRLLANNAAAIQANGADQALCDDCYRLLTLGNNPMSLHRGSYLGVLVEVEFLSNPDVVEGLILRPDSPEIVAGGLRNGLAAYFAALPTP
jgi:N-acetylmuramoyl-L-alanine amidase